jgi:CAAX prenyl protease-like protein
MNWALASIRIFGASIVVPLMEELFWRSYFMRWITNHNFLELDPGKVGIWAFSITAVMFASEHNLFVAGVLAGIAYNWLYIRSRNLWVPIMAHSVTNGLLGLWVIYTHNWQFW